MFTGKNNGCKYKIGGELNEPLYQNKIIFNRSRWDNNCTVTPLFYICCYGAFFIMSKDFRDYEFKFWFRIGKGYFPWYRIVKFRGANNIDLHILGLKLNWGMPYLHKFIYEQGYDAGFRGD